MPAVCEGWELPSFGGQAESHVASRFATVCSYQYGASLARVTGCPLASVLIHVLDIQDYSPLPASLLQAGSSSFAFHLLSFWACFFFSWTLIFHPFFLVGPQTASFPNLNSPCAEAHHVISFAVGADSSLFMNWRVRGTSLLLHLGVKRICDLPVPVAHSSRQFKSSVLEIATPPPPSGYVPPAGISQFRLLFLPFAKWSAHFCLFLLLATVFLQQSYCEGGECGGNLHR